MSNKGWPSDEGRPLASPHIGMLLQTHSMACTWACACHAHACKLGSSPCKAKVMHDPAGTCTTWACTIALSWHMVHACEKTCVT